MISTVFIAQDGQVSSSDVMTQCYEFADTVAKLSRYISRRNTATVPYSLWSSCQGSTILPGCSPLSNSQVQREGRAKGKRKVRMGTKL